MISESDWKKFKKIKAAALEKMCGQALVDFQDAINEKDPSNHGRYLYLYKLVENYDKRISMVFDYHSRSKAMIQLILMKSEGLLDESDIQSFSPELQEIINRQG